MSLRRFSKQIEVGCDEAGRGSLSGPVVAAAVILPQDFINDELNDSKKLTHAKRDKLNNIILDEALACEVGIVKPKKIDEINILNASILAMHKALEKIDIDFNLILIDGPYFKSFKNKKHQCIIRGDSKFYAIAAASIIAKTYRDNLMKKIHDKFPEYMWCQNKGYPTKEHKKAIKKHGPSIHHRRSFKLIDKQMSLKI
ncbi:MAG: ribonuclease HII [Flavobacteriales bacterium]|nr:ribonuclease HII [Flavobacteriales bacterium]